MRLRITAITNLFPTPWEPLRASFNKQQLTLLGELHSLQVLVPVEWRTWFFKNKKEQDIKISGLSISYFSFLYIPKFLRFLHGISLFICLTLQCFIKIIRSRPDCFFAIWAFPDSVATTLVAKILRIPVVAKVHGNDINVMTDDRWRRWQIVWVMKNAKAILAVSNALKEKLISLGVDGGKIHVVYNGINFTSFFQKPVSEARSELNLDQNRQVVLFVGNLKKAKGCLELVQAFAQVAHDFPNLDLHFIGEGEMKHQIIGISRQKSLVERVFLHGSKPHQDICSWYNAATIISLPSYSEGVPNVLLEAMACGRPVVATEVGGIPEIITSSTGILVPCKDVHALSVALKTALQGSWDSDKIASHAKCFTWERNIEQLNKIIQSSAV